MPLQKKPHTRIRILKSKELARCIAIWLKGEHGYGPNLPDERRPFASAIWEVCREEFPKIWAEMNQLLTFEELRDALAPFGIKVLRTDEDQAHA